MSKDVPYIPTAIIGQVVEYIRKRMKEVEPAMLIEAAASCAIEGNQLGDELSTTIQRFLSGKSVGERYLFQLGWFLRNMEDGNSLHNNGDTEAEGQT
jgi:hypothetical protein